MLEERNPVLELHQPLRLCRTPIPLILDLSQLMLA
jgi:hypothetical protein